MPVVTAPNLIEATQDCGSFVQLSGVLKRVAVKLFSGPSVQPNVPVPPPVDPILQPGGQVNIVLFGSDQRPDSGGFRTDTIVLVTLNKELGRVSLVSFPRDLYVYVPGWTMQRRQWASA